MIAIDMRVTLTTAQRNAWQTIRPVPKTHLAKIWRVYRACPDDRKAELLSHNPILAAVVDMLGVE
jgi:hypothetical protein